MINNVLGVVRFYEDGQKYGKVASSNRQVYQAQTIDQEKEHTYHWRDYLSHLYSFISEADQIMGNYITNVLKIVAH